MKVRHLKRINLVGRFGDPASNDPLVLEPSPSGIAMAIRTGMCPVDRAFDRFFPDELRLVSAQYWTPLLVAMRAAEWLDELQVQTVLDIGSGAGKFCVAAALACRSRFTGIEHRPRLVAAARELARVFEVDDRVTFLGGSLGETEVPEAEAYYLYNPFGENLFGSRDHLDEDVELGFERYSRDVARVRELLRRAPIGTCVLVYNGFGGQLPLGYQEIRADHQLPNPLCLWKKTSARGAGPGTLPMAS
ncbi:MAG: methyltransferase domain-containing protein [Byssovorax sp.]